MSPLRRMPIATRLALLFATVTALIFSIAGVHLYHSLSEQLQSRDDVLLLSTVEHLRHMLQEFESIEAVRAAPHSLLDVALGYRGLLLALKDSKGALIAYSARDAALIPDESPLAADRSPDAAAVRVWHGSNGRQGRAIAAWGRVDQRDGDRVLLLVAREAAESEVVLKAHRDDVLLTMLMGVLATALLGYVIARRGLRPVQAVAQTAGRVTASQLGERLRIEDAPAELEGMIRAFNHMLDRLEDSFRRLTQFSSDIAHDLRTPISNLMIQTQVTLAQPRPAADYEALLASNVEEYERLTRMIENMLFLARADNAQVALNKETISVDAELKRIAEYFDGMADEAGVVLDVEASGAIIADPLLLRRAVSNLVANAISYTPRGGHITICGHAHGDGKDVIEVSNPGSGIPPEHLARIFDRFYRIEVSRAKSRLSSGLGLAIVKSIMTLHGGDIQVESVPNKLTTFKLVFPKSQSGS